MQDTIAIVGLGYPMVPLDTDDEIRKAVGEQFVKDMCSQVEYEGGKPVRGPEVLLVATPRSHNDKISIAVYLNHQRIGYASRFEEELREFIQHDFDCIIRAWICGNDGHLALLARIIEPDENRYMTRYPAVIKTPKPYADTIWLDLVENDLRMDSFHAEMASYKLSDWPVERWNSFIDEYISLDIRNICCEDFYMFTALLKRFREAIYEGKTEYSYCLKRLTDFSHQYAKNAFQETHLRTQYEALYKVAHSRNRFIQQYETYQFGKPKEAVSREIIEKTKRELVHWLYKHYAGILCDDEWDWKSIAGMVSSMNLTRQDVYSVFEVMILIDWLSGRQVPEEAVKVEQGVQEGAIARARAFVSPYNVTPEEQEVWRVVFAQPEVREAISSGRYSSGFNEKVVMSIVGLMSELDIIPEKNCLAIARNLQRPTKSGYLKYDFGLREKVKKLIRP